MKCLKQYFRVESQNYEQREIKIALNVVSLNELKQCDTSFWMLTWRFEGFLFQVKDHYFHVVMLIGKTMYRNELSDRYQNDYFVITMSLSHPVILQNLIKLNESTFLLICGIIILMS